MNNVISRKAFVEKAKKCYDKVESRDEEVSATCIFAWGEKSMSV
jgi:hypothetical protein